MFENKTSGFRRQQPTIIIPLIARQPHELGRASSTSVNMRFARRRTTLSTARNCGKCSLAHFTAPPWAFKVMNAFHDDVRAWAQLDDVEVSKCFFVRQGPRQGYVRWMTLPFVTACRTRCMDSVCLCIIASVIDSSGGLGLVIDDTCQRPLSAIVSTLSLSSSRDR